MRIRPFRILSAMLLAGICVGAAAAASLQAPDAGQGYSAADLYNQGNSLARAHRFGSAILSYERAALLAPGNQDIEANLTQVRTEAGVPAASRSWLGRTLRTTSPNLFFAAGILGLIALGAGVLCARFQPLKRRLGWIAAAAGAGLIAVSACDAAAMWPVMQEAVILHETPVKLSPVPAADTKFDLSEGRSVRVKAKHANFALVEAEGGRSGWVPKENLAFVVS